MLFYGRLCELGWMHNTHTKKNLALPLFNEMNRFLKNNICFLAMIPVLVISVS